MAIDDNTSYELTGYQVKDLANKVRAKADSSSLASVATSGLYSDLTGAPTIPTVYNGTLTIKQNGTTIDTFTANQSTNVTVDLAGGIYADDPTTPANPDAWIAPSDIDWSAFRTVLYSNYTGTNGAVTLSESAANFTYLDIFYRDVDQNYSCTRVYSPNGKNASLMTMYTGSSTSDNSGNVKGKTIVISGTSITVKSYAEQQTGGMYNNNYIYITRVEGWKI